MASTEDMGRNDVMIMYSANKGNTNSNDNIKINNFERNNNNNNNQFHSNKKNDDNHNNDDDYGNGYEDEIGDEESNSLLLAHNLNKKSVLISEEMKIVNNLSWKSLSLKSNNYKGNDDV